MPSRRAQPSPSGHGPALQMDRVILPTTSTIMRLWNLFPPTNTPSTTQRLTNAENPPEDSREEENFDLIKRYQTDPDAPPSSQDYNMDLAASVDQFSKNTAKCVNLAQTTLECSGTRHKSYYAPPTRACHRLSGSSGRVPPRVHQHR